MDLKQHIRSIPDFPKPGILFYDISTLLAHPDAWQTTVQRLATVVRPHQPDLLVGIESRGFLVAAPLAYELGRGFAMVRKKGKLPGPTVRFAYDLELPLDGRPQNNVPVEVGKALAHSDGGDHLGGLARIPQQAFRITLQRWARASFRCSPSGTDCARRPVRPDRPAYPGAARVLPSVRNTS